MQTLNNVLLASSAETLKKIAINRNIEAAKLIVVKDKRQLCQMLANEISRRDSISSILKTCNLRELRLLQVLITKEPSSAIPWRHVLANLVYKNETAVNQTMDSLTEKGLAFRIGSQVFIPEQLKSQVPVSLADRHSIERCLTSYDAVSLKRLMENHGLASSTKAQNIERLVGFLRTPSNTDKILSALSDDEKQVLNMILAESGAATPTQIINAIGPRYREDFFRYDWQDRWKNGAEKNPIDRLLGKGLIYAIAYSYGYNLFLVVPYDLIAIIADRSRANLWDTEPPQIEKFPSSPPFTVRHETLLKDTVSLLGSFALMDMQRTNTGYIHKTSLKNAGKLLSIQEDRYASFLYALLREGQFIRMDPEKATYQITPRGLSWLSKESFTQISMLFDTWSLSNFWGEMYSDPLQKASSYRSSDVTSMVRRAGLNQLALANSDDFYITASVDLTLNYYYPLLFETENMDYGLLDSLSDFMGLLVNECLYWLGAIELAWTEQPKAIAIEPEVATRGKGAKKLSEAVQSPKPIPILFRVTPLGKTLLGFPGAKEIESAPTENHFIVQANSEIFLTPYLAPSLRYALTLFTEIPKAGASNVVLLSNDAVRKALDKGLNIDEIMAFLQKYSKTGVPQNVEYLLREVAGKHGHIHIGSVTMYLTTDTPLMMKELKARREFEPLFVRNLTDTIALLKSEDGPKLLRDLRKAGYLPVSDDYDSGRLTIPEPPQIESKASEQADRTPVAAPNRQKGSNLDALVNWALIAGEDAPPQKAAAEASSNDAGADTPKDAIQSLENIRFAMLDAIKKKYSLQMLYTPKNGVASQIVNAEPRHVMGGFAMIYLSSEKTAKTINLNTVKWVRRV